MAQSTITAVRPRIRLLELGSAGLFIVLFGAFAVDVLSAIPGVTWLSLAISGSLALTALVGTSIDASRTLVAGDLRGVEDWQRLAAGLACLLACALALLTLFWVVASVQTLLFPPERSGVLFGPLLALFTGVPLAVFVFGREAVRLVTER